jgi:phosphoesterase RecJ-like protein
VSTVDSTTFPTLEEVLPEIRAIIEGSEHIVCLAHKDADADSLGSALAFAAALRLMGKTPHPVVPEPRPYLLEYLPGFDTLETAPERIDAVFTFDCATTGRFGDKQLLVQGQGLPVVNVDHHMSNTLYGTVNLIQPEASASGQVVFRLLNALGAPISPHAATNLYAALLTDTGGFRHENTNEAALRLGADLVALGADPAWVALKSYKSKPVTMTKLEALSVSALRTELDGRLVWSEVTQAMIREAGADMVQSEAIIDELQSIDGIAAAVLFKELGPDLTKISIRTRGHVDATAVAMPFGGGGHLRAAGAELPCGLAEAQRRVLPLARRLIEPEAA